MATSVTNHAGGISIAALIVAAAVSLTYYQYYYVPEVNAKPVLPDAILHPPDQITIKISVDSAVPTNTKNFDPKLARGVIGISNKIVWHNVDAVPHTVTSDEGYKDQINGEFNSLAHEEGGGFVLPNTDFTFTFTKTGEYAYHCEPHPWMKGQVAIVENFS